MTRIHLLLASLAVLGLSACQSYPERRPDLAVLPAVYPPGPADAAGLADLDWNLVVRDPRLGRLVAMSLTQSRDLRTALLEVEAARAQSRVQDASLWPQIQGSAQKTATHASTQGAASDASSAGLSLTAFELDLFGRLRAQSQSAFATYLAAEEGARAARITVASAVVEAYLAERAADERQQLARQTAADWSASLDLTQRLRAAGQADSVDLAQAEGQARSAEAELQASERAHRQALNALALAVGAPLPADLPAPMALADQPVRAQIAAGLPSDLLRRRPDILQAEQRLKAAQADVRAARAAFFPTLSLTGQYGLASSDLHGLFAGASRTWTWTPQITAPLFQGGRLRAQHALADARSGQAVAAYEKAVQTAFRETADGLAARATYDGQIAAQAGVVAAAERRADLSQRRLRAGIENRIELLEAQRGLLAARQTLIQLRQEQAIAAMSLYRALGGPVGPVGPADT